MIVKDIVSGRIAEAKRFRDFTEEEASNNVIYPERWRGDEIFMKLEEPSEGGCDYLYMFPEDVEIIEENGGNE